MQITSTRPSVTVAGIVLEATSPFSEGHVLNTHEANALNQTLVENLRNNFASKVKDAVEAAEKAKTPVDVAALQKEFDAYITEYAFGVRKAGAPRVVDPVERMARVIATEAVKAALKAKGYKLGEGEGLIGKEQLEKLVAAQAAKEGVRKEATRRVQAQTKLSLDDLGPI